MNKPISCDIFCTVVDNYGDIGVCWRLARQLANEHRIAVRLWVDDLASFCKLCHEADVSLARQHCRGVEIGHRVAPFPEIEPAHWVIEAFACKLPENYVAAMVAQEHQPAWINLEYLSAEHWVEGCHKLPSPHPSLPLIKYFFFPGFTRKTGGLLLERDLLARRDAFQRDTAQQQKFWQSFGMEIPGSEILKISLFGYENEAVGGLLDAWANGVQRTLCLVPEGRILPQVEAYFPSTGSGQAVPGDVFRRGNLQVRVLPFVEQERYDELLWACDINFVRGEDSCVRAQWAGKPFVWHIYPQHDGVHMQKLHAFTALYGTGLAPAAAQALRALWENWNPSTSSGQVPSADSEQAWNDFLGHRSLLQQHAQDWAQELSTNNLVSNLLDFFNSIDRMRDSKISVQAGTL